WGKEGEGKKEDGVLVEQAEADGGADEEEVARVAGPEEFDYKESGEDPEEVIERGVLHERAGAQGEGDGRGCGNELREPAAAHFFGHAASEEDANGLQQRGKEAEAHERSAEKGEGETRKRRGERRVRGIAPGEVAGVLEECEFVAVETVAIGGEEMEKNGGGGQEGEEEGIGSGLRGRKRERTRVCRSGSGGG